ncbi:MAG TPA: response regulator [Leptospiraceae bacterium]|nr:response regulator [Leptospiraceae bacterium]HMW06877.1 response regulator [Leptospiraceae bacterium]HMX34565.1 response regulator [Leptospiraceae bacterium]HMY32396.1 response regulator [Leptospiraceae bacterium]HMZ65308.1 response regulator [Leptospiraceae bacterium]
MEKKILVVEDDEHSGFFLKEALEIHGYKTSIAANGKIALEEYAKNPVPLIITDLEMPFMGGRELISEINKNIAPPLVIVQSAHHEVHSLKDIMKLGVYDYLFKPIQLADLILKVEKAFHLYQTGQI